jgi:hypothetical protein
LIGSTGTVDIGVDFVEDTVDEDIVIALAEDGGIICLGAGVGGVCFVGRGFSGFEGDTRTA